VYNTFGPGDAFHADAYAAERGPNTVAALSQGYGFSPSLDGKLDSITLALAHISGTNDAHIYLTDILPFGVNPPTLESWTLTGLPPENGSPYAPEVLTSLLHPNLIAGNTYYLYEKEDGDEENGWNPGADAPGILIQSFSGGPYTATNDFQNAFRVTVQSPAATPESSSFVTLGCLLLSSGGVGLWRKRKRRQDANP